MAIARPQDVVDEINKFYPFDDGPATFPLDESTVDTVRRILKLANHIPVELLRKGSEGQLFNHALAVISNALQKAAVQPSTVTVTFLQDMSEHGWENPVCTLRRLLRWCPNFTPQEVRRRLLDLAAENERATGSVSYRDDVAIFYLKNVPLGEIRRQMKILQDEELATMDQLSDGSCCIRLRTAGWKAVEEPVESTSSGVGRIFISCGQFTDEERSLGYALADAVNELTPYQGFFAQNESSLEGLAKNIFHALRDCVGLVAVMHHRGTVNTLRGQQVRGSVWIEQEIAIAAFLSEVEGRDIPVVLYLQNGISLEGVRQQLHLNPVMFTNNEDVLQDFQRADTRPVPLGSGDLSKRLSEGDRVHAMRLVLPSARGRKTELATYTAGAAFQGRIGRGMPKGSGRDSTVAA